MTMRKVFMHKCHTLGKGHLCVTWNGYFEHFLRSENTHGNVSTTLINETHNRIEGLFHNA